MSEKKKSTKTPAKPKVQIKKPKTTEDLVVLALESGSLEQVVRLLRDWCGSREIRDCLNKLHHRDPVDRFTHARRHAVEIYAHLHGLTPANLMVEIVGVLGRKDPKGAERFKLRMARKFLEEDETALIGAKSLANLWENNRGKMSNHGAYLKKITQGFAFT
jgi:hypothetical protein